MDKCYSNNISCNTIDLLKFIMAFVVVSIHTTNFETFNCLFANDLLQYVKCFAVPFFFAVSGYFLYRKLSVLPDDEHDVVFDKALRKTLMLYVIWSITYIPINLYGEYYEWGHTSLIVMISSMVRGWLFVGQNYGSWIMWYILAYIVALLLIKYLHRMFSYPVIIGISFLMLTIGWLYSFNHDTYSIALYDNLFKSTRNGFFWGFPCVCAGFVVSMMFGQQRTSRTSILLLGIVLLVALFIVPTSYRQLLYPVMGGVILTIGLLLPIHSESRVFVTIRRMSIAIYFMHLIPTFLYSVLFGIPFGLELFAYVSITSTMLSYVYVLTSRIN